MKHDLIVIGGGLAGSEAAWQAAERGLQVVIFEMRPDVQTGAHTGAWLAELVCSNSLGSTQPDRAPGLLKEELRRLGSMVLNCAEQTQVPAGGALAVDRLAFAQMVTRRILDHPNIELVRQEICQIPDGLTIIASGPLTSPKLSAELSSWMGSEHLYFYDAIAPIVQRDSINMSIAFRGSRYGRGDQPEGDYINCPLNREQYEAFVAALVQAQRIELKTIDQEVSQGVRAGNFPTFEGCLPIEVMASRGLNTLAFGPLRPVGIIDPRTASRPFANVQLRQDNIANTLYNLVGFQTNLTFSEQKRVFRMIPGLEEAHFERFGQMHRNTFIFSPAQIFPTLQAQRRHDLFFAGQISGVEGYVGNIATGLVAGVNVARIFHGEKPLVFPPTTMIGALLHYVTHADAADFQPMKANFGLMPEIDNQRVHGKRERGAIFSRRATADLELFMRSNGLAKDFSS